VQGSDLIGSEHWFRNPKITVEILLIKDVRSVLQCEHFEDKSNANNSDADVRTFSAKNFGFFKIYGVSWTRG